MNEFLLAVAGFPTALFSAALVVVLVFWLLVAAGGASQDMFDSDADTAFFGSAGLGGVPVTVAVSLFVVLAWSISVTGSLLLRGSGLTGVPYAVVACAVLAAAVLVPWRATRRLVRGLARLFPEEPGPSRQDFIGMTCTIRTGRVDAHFGQAEVRAGDGSTAVVQVRRLPGEKPGPDGPGLVAGSTGLLFAFDDDGEFFWVAPFSALDGLPDSGRPRAA